ncbi:MAG: hypothetical protein H0W25_09900 [Acidimicrobiia bacterium]|nr:hypothetical protein [Acidimicrobiia bacterium]
MVAPPVVESTFGSLDELAVRLDCTRIALDELDTAGTFGPENRSAAATCTLGGGAASLALFADTERRDAWIAQGREFGCDAARELDIPSFHFAVGANWAVEPADITDLAATETIAATLGGTARTIDC